MPLQDFLSFTLYGNSVRSLFIAITIFIGGILVLKVFQVFILRKLRRVAAHTRTKWDDEIVAIVSTLRPHVYTLISAYIALRWLRLPAEANKLINIVFLVLVTWESIQIAQRLIVFAVRGHLAKDKDEARKNASVIRTINFFVKLGLWTMALLLILQNLGIDVTSLIAGLGIGGVAIALAAQNILSDLFSSFSIYFDKPFVVDDFIQVGSHSGTVKNIGLKTTRLQALQGEELVISNKELTSSRIQNFGKMKKRRVVVTLGLEYDTPTEKLKQVPSWVKHIIDTTDGTDFDRAHFKEFSASSLDIEIVYYVTSGDYALHMDTLQNVNLAIKEKFEKECLSMAYPTQTVYVKNT